MNFKQYDTQWSELPYPIRPWVLRNCGCGEVSIANIITETAKYAEETPKTIQPYCKRFAASNGDGTYWSGIPAMMEHYGLTEVQEHATMSDLFEEMSKGSRAAVLLMGSRSGGTRQIRWTSCGHFIAATGYKKVNGQHYLFIKDSNSSSEERNGWLSYIESLRNDVIKVWSGKMAARALTVDGIGGTATVTRMQEFLDVKAYGEFTITQSLHKKWCPGFTAVEYGDKPSDTVKALQRWMGFTTCDGKWGKITSTLLQKKIGIKNCDGIFGEISVKYLQRYLNEHDKAVYPKSGFYSDRVKIGHAMGNEKGSLAGGKAGDQTGGEVAITDWSYSSKSGAFNHWLYVFRAKDVDTRFKIAQAMIDTCNNNHIGYDTGRPDRYTAYDEAERKLWAIKNITKNCETTCSQAVSMCLRAAGISSKYAPRHCDIAVMTSTLPKCDKFYVYGGKDYTSKSTNLQPGDILLSSDHTAIVVKSPHIPK